MKFQLSKTELSEKLSLASRFTSNKLATSTALQGVYLKSDGTDLHLYATDLNIYFHTRLPIPVNEQFQTVIDPRKILEFLQFLPPGDVSIEIQEKQVTMKQGKTKGNFPIIVGDDFPLPPALSDEHKKKLDVSFLTERLPRILFSASKDDARPVLTGVNFVPAEGELTIVTTDGFRLSLIREQKLSGFPAMIVPASFLQEILKGAKDAKEVSFGYSEKEKLVSFHIGTDEYYSRLIDGEFPPYERVIPSDVSTTAIVEKTEFLRNIKLISVFARDFSNVVVCEFGNGQIIMRPKKEGNEENTAVMDAEIEGDTQKIAFNFRYLLDFLNHIDGKTFKIEILRPEAPIALKHEKDETYLHIIMPVRIQE
jgi:DNA polymerase-3 subunit beta